MKARRVVSRRYGALGLVVLCLLFSLAGTAAVFAQDEGSIQGQVVNGTPGGSEVGAGIPVILHVLLGEAEVNAVETECSALP